MQIQTTPILTRMNEGSESKALHLYDSTATASLDITQLSCKHKAWIRWLCKCWCMNHIKSDIKHITYAELQFYLSRQAPSSKKSWPKQIAYLLHLVQALP